MDKAELAGAPRELLTPRVRLESGRLAHAPALMAAINASLPDLRYIAWGQHPVDLAWAESFSQRGARYIDDGDCLIYSAFLRDGGELVGRIDLHSFDLETPRAEIGYVADSRQAGRGLMREAVLAVVELAFSLGFLRIEAISDARNARALRFAASLGFTQEAVLRSHARDPQGGLCDEVLFALLHPSVR